MKAKVVFSEWEGSVTVLPSSKNRAFIEMLPITPRSYPASRNFTLIEL